MILACNHIHKSFITDVILDDVTFHIEEKEKIALIGMNGSGKTTLFRIISNALEPDSGEIIKSKNCSIGYLPQHVSIDSDKTVYNELLTVFNHLIEMEEELSHTESMISNAKPDDLDELVKNYDLLRESFEDNQGYMYKSLIRGVLAGLGLSDDAYDKPVSILSGGQKTRVALAKLLLQNPTVLLLDEPTNHLDIDAIEWLEGFLKSYTGAAIIISHDRYFLDRIVTKVVELEHHKSVIFEGNYSFYIKQKAINKEIEAKHYSNQQKDIKRQEQVIDKLRQFNREKSIKRADSREKLLNKVERIEKPLESSDGMKLTLTPQIQSGNDVLDAKELSKSFDDLKLFQNLNFQIKRGDKIALVGPNGIGKTTLFRIFMGTVEPSFGEVTLGSNVLVGYYDQEHQTLDPSSSIIDELQNAFPDTKTGTIRNVLAAFLFTGDDVFKLISSLSGGEKGRVALAKIMLTKANFLLLDEPTNHLDILSKEILEAALVNYEGTVLYISHDRYFINKTATKVFDMSTTGMTTYLGNYDYFALKKLEVIDQSSEETPVISDSKDQWLKAKETQTNLRRLENQLAKTEDDIHEVEATLSFIEAQLCLEEVYTDPQKSEAFVLQQSGLEKQLEKLYAQWEEDSVALEENN
ncbi:MAG TPA: ABC-F type ribosomal protection protein [Epulopiscium sp.]|nr:ABC-F type ribosomal protection protein [Candidatus Epulonipiscium sp.]